MVEGRLTVCATPIGNLGDISDRLRATLVAADVVYAEDTRRTAILLNHIGVSTDMRSLFAGNEKARTEELVSEVAAGKKVVLVSDAGMPTISDPGAEAVREVRASGYPVTVVPGPSAVVTALALSGFGADRFAFEGFLPKKGKERQRRLAAIASEDRAVVIFASPHRIGADLDDLRRACGDERPVAVMRELTKLHEEAWLGSLADAAEHWSGEEVRGELTLVVGGAPPWEVSLDAALDQAMTLVADGVTVSEAARVVSKDTGVARREIYQSLLQAQDRS